jgi:hypothetical protein
MLLYRIAPANRRGGSAEGIDPAPDPCRVCAAASSTGMDRSPLGPTEMKVSEPAPDALRTAGLRAGPPGR